MEDKTGQRLKGKRGNKKRKEEQAGRSKAKYYAAAAGICLAALSAGFVTGKVLSEKKAAVLQAARMEREKSGKEKAEEEKRAAGKAAQELGSQVLGFPAESAKNVMEALENRPPSVELTEENREGFAQIASCKIDSELDKIAVKKDGKYVMEHVDLETYVKEYAKAFRVFYNAIKSTNGSCNIYISLDQQWDRNNAASGNYDARDILDVFNREIKAEGNIDWGLAIHPYNVPLTTPYIWNAGKYVKALVDTPMVTMANIHIVTDYMQQEQFLTEEGDVRSIILSELGYTSSKGEEVQAAAMVYAYKVAEANQHIDSILFSRQTDAVEEIAQGLALGLNRPDGSHKYAYNVYKYMDTEQGEKHTGFAKNIVGISGWGEVIKQR